MNVLVLNFISRYNNLIDLMNLKAQKAGVDFYIEKAIIKQKEVAGVWESWDCIQFFESQSAFDFSKGGDGYLYNKKKNKYIARYIDEFLIVEEVLTKEIILIDENGELDDYVAIDFEHFIAAITRFSDYEFALYSGTTKIEVINSDEYQEKLREDACNLAGGEKYSKFYSTINF